MRSNRAIPSAVSAWLPRGFAGRSFGLTTGRWMLRLCAARPYPRLERYGLQRLFLLQPLGIPRRVGRCPAYYGRDPAQPSPGTRGGRRWVGRVSFSAATAGSEPTASSSRRSGAAGSQPRADAGVPTAGRARAPSRERPPVLQGKGRWGASLLTRRAARQPAGKSLPPRDIHPRCAPLSYRHWVVSGSPVGKQLGEPQPGPFAVTHPLIKGGLFPSELAPLVYLRI